MGRSSRILTFVVLLAAMPALAPAAWAQRGVHAMVRMPTNIGGRIVMRAAAVPAIRPWAVTRPIVLRDARRLTPVARRNTLGIDGIGLGQSIASDLATPQIGGYGPTADPSLIQGVQLPPCVRPQIIKIGLGIRRAPPTRLIYGPPTGCAL